MNKICSVIVSYNPDNNLALNLRKLTEMVDFIVVIDNGSTSCESLNILKQIEKDINNINIIYNHENKGIASALNQGCVYAKDQDYDWVLTLDDDSIVDELMIANMIKAYEQENNNKIVLLTPNILKYNEINKSINSKYVDIAITSGSLIHVQIFEEIGWFKDDYFIDMVDVEFCLRIKKHNYKILKVSNASLFHRLGREKLIFKIGKFEWKTLNHNEIRKYYIFRNTIQMYKEYFFISPLTLVLSTKGIIKILIDTLILEENKLKKLKMIKIGIIDGIINKMGKLDDTEISR